MAPCIPNPIAVEVNYIFANLAGILVSSTLQKSVSQKYAMTALLLRAMQGHIPIKNQLYFVLTSPDWPAGFYPEQRISRTSRFCDLAPSIPL